MIAPYPFSRWPRYRRAEAELLTRLSAHGALGPSSSPALDAAAELLGAPLDMALGVPELWTAAQLGQQLPSELSAIVFAVRTGARDRALVLELSRELVAAVTDRALGGDARVLAPDEPLDALELGVLGYVAARCAAHTRGALRVAGALRSTAEVLTALGAGQDERAVVLPIRAALGDAHGHGRLIFTSLPGEAAVRALDVPHALLGLPVTLCAHAATLALDWSELAALEPGDIVFPERTRLSRDAQGWYGQLAVHALGAPGQALNASLAKGRLALGNEASMRAPRADGRGRRRMHDQDDQDDHDETPNAADGAPLGERIARDAPIELCLELARFVLPLEELLALKPGAVWSTGRAIGEHVTLSAAGRSIARGELVDIDGEIGVRILERA